MFYRKYRPKQFKDLVGNSSITSNIQNAISKGSLGHALLFHGPRGTGKTTTARLTAKALACENPTKEGDACLKCETCKLIESKRYTDLIEIDAASNNSVDNIRSINEKVGLSPTHGKIKFYIIDEVHMLSKGAFNALLKTLEEPPEHAYFVLATTEPEKVIETIKSRCQQFEFKRASVKDIVKKLKYICEEEGIVVVSNEDVSAEVDSKIKVSDLERIAQASRGGYRDAETMLEQVIVGGVSVSEVVSSVSLEYVTQLFEYLINKNSQSSIELINKVYQDGKNLEGFNKEVLYYLRQLILIQNNLSSLIDLDPQFKDKAFEQASEVSVGFILKSLKAFNESLENLKISYIPTLPLEAAVLEIIGDSGISKGQAASSKGSPDLAPSSSGSKEDTGKKIKDTQFSEDSRPETVTESLSSGVGDRGDSSNSNLAVEQPSNEPHKKDEGKKSELLDQDFQWEDFVKEIQKIKPTLIVALKSCKYIGITKNKLVLEAKYVFHKERIEIHSTKTLLEETLEKMLNAKTKIECRLANRANQKLTDKNVSYVTINADQVKISSNNEDDFAIPKDDPNYVGSTTVSDNNKGTSKSGSGDALDDFSGDFSV